MRRVLTNDSIEFVRLMPLHECAITDQITHTRLRGRFLISEESLSTCSRFILCAHRYGHPERVLTCTSGQPGFTLPTSESCTDFERRLQGYLAHKKRPPP